MFVSWNDSDNFRVRCIFEALAAVVVVVLLVCCNAERRGVAVVDVNVSLSSPSFFLLTLKNLFWKKTIGFNTLSGLQLFNEDCYGKSVQLLASALINEKRTNRGQNYTVVCIRTHLCQISMKNANYIIRKYGERSERRYDIQIHSLEIFVTLI